MSHTMKRSLVPVCALVAVAGIAAAQQPNTPTATLTVNAVNGPPWPLTAGVAPGSTAIASIAGNPNAPFSLFASATGLLQAGAANIGGNIVDLPLVPAPGTVLNGFPVGFTTGPTGTFTFTVVVPPLGLPPAGIPLGPAAAIQAIVADPTVPIGWRATAATQAVVTNAPPLTTTLPMGNNTTLTVNIAALGVTFPFYGANYTLMNVDSNGYVTFGTAVASQFFSNPILFNGGPPRIAGFWTDLDPTLGGVVNLTAGLAAAGNPPFIRLDWIGVPNAFVGGPPVFNFSILMRGDGYLEISNAAITAPSLSETSVGIGPGGNLSTAPTKNIVGILTTAPNAYVGGINEAFHGYYGIITLMPFYTGVTNNPYNLGGFTLHFLPAGAGSMPGASNRYVLY
jgi:hypothetical protein